MGAKMVGVLVGVSYVVETPTILATIVNGFETKFSKSLKNLVAISDKIKVKSDRRNIKQRTRNTRKLQVADSSVMTVEK